MASLHTDDFRREAVRIVLTSGLTHRQVVTDLGIGLSTLSKWIQRSRPAEMPPASDIDLAKANEVCFRRRTPQSVSSPTTVRDYGR